MSIPLPIAEAMAAALRTHQCAKTTYGQWPAFKVGGKFKERDCAQCDALALYDAHRAIVEVPEVKKP